MKNKIILFDIDRTIFDTDKMSKMFNDLMLQILNYPNNDEFQKTKEEYLKSLNRDREFEPENFCKNLANKFNKNRYQNLVDVIFAPKYAYIYKESVYKETFPVLEELKTRYRLGIYSEGTEKFQNHKFNSLSLNKYFDKDLIFIVDAKDNKETLEKLPKGQLLWMIKK